MTITVLWLIGVTMSSVLAQAPSAERRPQSTSEQQVKDAENARRDAILRNDTAALDGLVADSFVATLDNGDVKTKADEQAVNRASDRKVEAWESTEVAIQVYGDAAVVTGRAHVKDVLRGVGRSFAFRFTHVWVKSDRGWRLVARHISSRTSS